MPDEIAGFREKVALGAPPSIETLRMSRCALALGPEATPTTIDGKAIGHTLRMAVVVTEAQRRFKDLGGRESLAYWSRVWSETLAPDGRADHADAWIAVRVGERAWSDGAPKRYARLSAAAEAGGDAVERDARPAFEMKVDEDAAVCALFDRSLSEDSPLRFEMTPRLGRVLQNDALAFAANLFDLANLAGQVVRTAAEDGGEARFFDLLTRKRRLRETLRRRMRIVQRRAHAAEKAYRVVFAPERPSLLKLADFDALSTADFMRVAARMLGLETAPRRIASVADAVQAPRFAAQPAPADALRAAG